MATLFQRIFTSTLSVSAILLACKAFGYVEKASLGALYGDAGRFQMDVFLATAVLVVLFYDILRYSLIPALIPALERARLEEGEHTEWRIASTFINVLVPLLFLGVIAGILFPERIVVLFNRESAGVAGGSAIYQDRLRLSALVLRIMLSGGVFLIVGSIAYAMLNSRRHFAAAALGDLTFKAIAFLPLAALLILKALGPPWDERVLTSGLRLLASGVAAACAGLFLVQLVPLRDQLRLYRLSVDLRDPAVRGVVGSAALPFVYACFFWGARRVFDIYFGFWFVEQTGSYGYYSGLEFSYRLCEFPFRIVIEPLGYVVFPFLTALAVAGKRDELSVAVMTAIRAVILLLVPAAVALFLLRGPVVAALFRFGAFGPEMQRLATLPLGFYALGMVGFGVELILARVYFSMGEAKWPALLEIAAFLVYLLTVLMLRHSGLQHGCIALGFALARTAKALALFFGLATKLGTLRLRENVRVLTKIAVSGLFMGIVIRFSAGFLEQYLHMSSKVHQLVLVAAPALAGSLVYVVFILVLRVREVLDLVAMARERRADRVSLT